MSPRGDPWGHRGQPGSGSSELLTQPRAGDCSHPWDTNHTFHLLFASVVPTMNVTELVPHSFSLLETRPEPSLSKASFLPLGKIFWAQDHLSPSEWMVPSTSREADPSSGLVPPARAAAKCIFAAGQPQLHPLHQQKESEILGSLLICGGVHPHVGRNVPFCLV